MSVKEVESANVSNGTENLNYNRASQAERNAQNRRQQAKAMVVTSSRLQAVRYKKEFDKYIKAIGYKDYLMMAVYQELRSLGRRLIILNLF
ncbi:hypothetical protein [Fonticella tunisiensis]|uniref:hypothetical protein n=1 Tax=Fonticella tunisiensis TaxID=1096341 RepID=UPI001415169B|nr:hypothetical protein [Fonticella tunisiensis]